MSENLKRMYDSLLLLSEIKNKNLRKKVLFNLANNKNLYKALKEVAINLVNKNIKLSDQDKRNLSKYKKSIIALSKQKFKSSKRKKTIQQTGGFLPYLIPLLATVLSQIYGKS